MIFEKLPSDCIYHIFEYLEYNYETLYLCIFVSRDWFCITAPILWKDPFHSKNSVKTMIRCLSKESKDFFVKNNIELSFEVLDDDKPLLCNYSKFANELQMDDTSYDNSLNLIDEEIEVVKKEKWYLLLKELIKLIMTNSRIERIYLHCLENFLLLEQPKFNQCFSNLKELACDDNISSGLFHLLAQTTDRIEILDFKSLKSLNMQRCSLVNDFDDIFDENLKLNLLEKINVSIEGQDCIDIQPTFEDLFGALITTLPQQIKILSFRQKWLLLDDVLEMFFKKWTGYTPIHIELFNGCEEMIDDDIDNEVKMIELLTQYKEKGLLNFNFFDSIAKFDIFLESL
ncbi:11196_t:CDS:2 [Entrophospora sp. SA101]|nr:11196_t:CDS:2 [Entrophospora sp. SA101]